MSQNIRKGTTQGSKVIQVFSDKPITKKQALGALSILYSELTPKEQINMAEQNGLNRINVATQAVINLYNHQLIQQEIESI